MIKFTIFETTRDWGTWKINIGLTEELIEENSYRVRVFAIREKDIKTVSLYYSINITEYSDKLLEVIINKAFETTKNIIQNNELHYDN